MTAIKSRSSVPESRFISFHFVRDQYLTTAGGNYCRLAGSSKKRAWLRRCVLSPSLQKSFPVHDWFWPEKARFSRNFSVWQANCELRTGFRFPVLLTRRNCESSFTL